MFKTEAPLVLDQLTPGNHACFFYASESEHQQVLEQFSRQGREQREKVIYLADPHAFQTFLNFLQNDGLKPGLCPRN